MPAAEAGLAESGNAATGSGLGEADHAMTPPGGRLSSDLDRQVLVPHPEGNVHKAAL